ncbi:DUF2795 domain-containing protein [Streptomyces sp. CA-210063]|uniref:DUF2795 domain-containing protein n=1 Tax=Streptomyces sp. CA-210063 TaxID=2801029 RepID=UPI00214CF819|nr:DUF2795 domain-containing protein [Streptomyces sp. CA-210063]UUU29741.1 DUF2795 domain-containing protein [Streptomyces sp. CA-210063]
MKHELEGHLRSGRPTHVEEAYEPEPPADDDIRVDPGGPVPPPGEERERAQADTEAEALRSELARHLERSVFPADRQTVLDVLEAHHAPDAALAAVRRLSDNGEYANVTEIVNAIPHRHNG